MIKAIVFDLDDTLVPEIEYIKSGYRYIDKSLKQKHPELMEIDVYKELIDLFSISSKNVFNRFFDIHQIGYTKEDILSLVEEYRDHMPSIKLKDTIITLMISLRQKGYKLGVITDGYKKTQKNKVMAIELEKYVDYIVITDELGSAFWKPHPKPFELMSEVLNVKFNEMIYIGDNPSKDFHIASVYPIKTIRIKRSQGVYQTDIYMNNIKEDILIRSFKELEEAITEIERMNDDGK